MQPSRFLIRSVLFLAFAVGSLVTASEARAAWLQENLPFTANLNAWDIAVGFDPAIGAERVHVAILNGLWGRDLTYLTYDPVTQAWSQENVLTIPGPAAIGRDVSIAVRTDGRPSIAFSWTKQLPENNPNTSLYDSGVHFITKTSSGWQNTAPPFTNLAGEFNKLDVTDHQLQYTKLGFLRVDLEFKRSSASEVPCVIASRTGNFLNLQNNPETESQVFFSEGLSLLTNFPVSNLTNSPGESGDFRVAIAMDRENSIDFQPVIALEVYDSATSSKKISFRTKATATTFSSPTFFLQSQYPSLQVRSGHIASLALLTGGTIKATRRINGVFTTPQTIASGASVALTVEPVQGLFETALVGTGAAYRRNETTQAWNQYLAASDSVFGGTCREPRLVSDPFSQVPYAMGYVDITTLTIAQPRQLTIKVQGPTGTPLQRSAVAISVEDINQYFSYEPLIRFSPTNGNATYHYSMLPADTYVITVNASGYQPKTVYTSVLLYGPTNSQVLTLAPS